MSDFFDNPFTDSFDPGELPDSSDDTAQIANQEETPKWSIEGSVALINRELDRDPHLKSYHTRRGYAADLAAFEAWRSGRPVTKPLVEEYAGVLQAAGRSPNTVNRMLVAVRWWARRMVDLARGDTNLTTAQTGVSIKQANRVATVSNVEGSGQPKGRQVTFGELAALMQTCAMDPNPAGARDAAMIAVAWVTGARRAEIAGLTLGDFHIDVDAQGAPDGEKSGDLLIRSKGDKVRSTYIYDGAFFALTDWLTVRGKNPGPLFCAIGKGNRIHPEHPLSGEAMSLILNERIKQAGLKPLTWHDFRRSFGENLLRGGTDLVTVQRLMGHASPTTTSNYDHRANDLRRTVVPELFVPYHER